MILLIPLSASRTFGRSAAAAATCDLPAQQQLDAAKNVMNGEKAVEFPIRPYPALGKVSVEIFIRAKEIWVNPGFEISVRRAPFGYPVLDANGHPSLTARYGDAYDMPGLFLQGDGRDWDLNFSPDKTRAFAVFDFVAGRGYFVVNKSVSKLRVGVVGPASYTVHESWEARDTFHQWGNANNWFYGDWISASTYRFRLHIKESAFGTSWVAPAIDTQVQINKDNGQAQILGDTLSSPGFDGEWIIWFPGLR